VSREWVRGADFIVAKCADDQKVADIGVRYDVLQQLEGRGVEPLEIVQKDDERMLRSSEYAQKGSEYHVKTCLGFRGWKLHNRRLSTDDELELGDEVHNELPIRANRLMYRVSPTLNLRLAFAQDLASQGAECLRQRGIRNVSLVLIKLSEDEVSARQHDRFVQLMHD